MDLEKPRIPVNAAPSALPRRRPGPELVEPGEEHRHAAEIIRRSDHARHARCPRRPAGARHHRNQTLRPSRRPVLSVHGLFSGNETRRCNWLLLKKAVPPCRSVLQSVVGVVEDTERRKS